MHEPGIIQSFFLIFSGAALLAAAALFARQPFLIAYIALGALLGPHGIAWVENPALLEEIAEIGIIFLLFLVGLDLRPSRLRNMLGESLLTGLVTTSVFFGIGLGTMLAFGFTLPEALITGVAVSFSSTIMGIKLLPTTVLHHRHIGEMVVSLLLIQDLLAVIALLVLAGVGGGATGQGDAIAGLGTRLGLALGTLPLLGALAWAGVRWLLVPLLQRFDAFTEFVFLLAIGWCLGLASLAQAAGLSLEIGALIAGVSLAATPVAAYIVDNLKPLRDFFLVLFFFGVGAELNGALVLEVWLPTLLLGTALVLAKPPTFALALRAQGESSGASWEVGARLGQASEFSLLVSYVAGAAALIGAEAAHVIQGATVFTLIVNTYLVIFRYPSPIAPVARLRRD
ncbi:MAG: cation:proton antiporter [Pseudomonadota bacterium]